MGVKIQALHFNATEQLQAFVDKKCAKLQRVCEDLIKVDVVLKVVKPETAMNKQAQITASIPGNDVHAEKICDTFEQAVDECLDALKGQLVKIKEKSRQK